MENIYRLTNKEKLKLANRLDKIPYDAGGGKNYLIDIEYAAYTSLPRRIIEVLKDQKNALDPKPYLIFENLPIDCEVFTTPDPELLTPSAKTGVRSENIAIMFSILLGEPYSIDFEGSHIINNLIPTTNSAREYNGLGSKVELDFHIENAALKHMGDENYSPQGIVFTGVRHDPQGPLTRVSDARLALNSISSDDLQYLREPLYKIKLPYRWRTILENSDMHETEAVPLVKGSLDLPEISAAFYPDMVKPITERSMTAFQNFYEAVKRFSFGIDLTPGRLVYVDNRFTLHSRDKFTASIGEDGQPLRWIQRVFIAPNLWNHRRLSKLKPRVFKPSERIQ